MYNDESLSEPNKTGSYGFVISDMFTPVISYSSEYTTSTLYFKKIVSTLSLPLTYR